MADVNAARVVVLAVLAVASVVVYLLMRHPGLRRPQFQGGRAFSRAVSFGCAVALFVVFAWLTSVLG